MGIASFNPPIVDAKMPRPVIEATDRKMNLSRSGCFGQLQLYCFCSKVLIAFLNANLTLYARVRFGGSFFISSFTENDKETCRIVLCTVVVYLPSL